MWGNLLSQTGTAKERLAAALERTGDIITDHATAHVARQATASKEKNLQPRPGGGDTPSSESTDSSPSSSADTKDDATRNGTPSESRIPPSVVEEEKEDEPALFNKQQQELLGKIQVGWGSVLNATKQVVVATKTAVEKQAKQHHELTLKLADSTTDGDDTASVETTKSQQQKQEMLNRLNAGWGTVVNATRGVVEATTSLVEQESVRFLNKSREPLRRDVKLPLDVDALKDAEVVYVTDRLIAMGHPAMQSSTDGDITGERKLAAVGHLLQKRHKGKYMVWNLSEVEYDYSVMDDQVLGFQFPGSPSPPLGLMLKLLLSIESWLKADPKNVAVVHCLTGKGRTSTVLAAFLCWMGEAGFHDVNQALEYIAACKRVDVETLTIPSQRRYAMYFANMLDGVRPHQPPLVLKRIIMSEAPKFGKNPHEAPSPLPDQITPATVGCSPYLQIFKAGQLILTTTAQTTPGSPTATTSELPFVTSDSAVIFTLDSVVQGDILVRCRHLTKRGQRISMFRAAFHTGYTPPKVMRLSKAQLDGACNDDRFSAGFFIDLIFEACDASTASKHLMAPPVEGEGGKEVVGAVSNEAEMRRQQGTLQSGGGGNVSSFEYDTMLHRDGRFWDVIATRRQECLKNTQSSEKNNELLSGPTVGRRRDFDAVEDNAEAQKDGNDNAKDGTKESDKRPNKKKDMYLSFSIGGGDLQLTDEEVRQEQQASPPKRDELMEALMAIDDDNLGASNSTFKNGGEGEIVFPDDDEEIMRKENLFRGEDGSTDEAKQLPKKADIATPTIAMLPADEGAKSNPKEDNDSEKKEGSSEEKTKSLVAELEGLDDDDDDLDFDAGNVPAGGEPTSLDYDDDDDAELDDLENFLTKANATT